MNSLPQVLHELRWSRRFSLTELASSRASLAPTRFWSWLNGPRLYRGFGAGSSRYGIKPLLNSIGSSPWGSHFTSCSHVQKNLPLRRPFLRHHQTALRSEE